MTYTHPDIKQFKLDGLWKSWFAFVLLVLLIVTGLILSLTRFIEIDFNQYWWLLSVLFLLSGLFLVGYGVWYYLQLITFQLTIEDDRIIYKTFVLHREITFTEVKGFHMAFQANDSNDLNLKIRKLIAIIPLPESGRKSITINQYIGNYSHLVSWLSANFTLLKEVV